MNNVSLVGRLTKDVDLRYTSKKATAVATFVLAVDRDKKKGNENKVTDFIPIVIWGKAAEFANKYFAKGHRIALQGSIHTRKWEDEEKSRHYVTEVIASKLYFADTKYKEIDINGTIGDNESDEENELDDYMKREEMDIMEEVN